MRILGCLALATACSNVHHTTDAPPIDAVTDTFGMQSGTPSATAVKLKVTRSGRPVSGVAAFFQNADSSLVFGAVTNDEGLAWAEMTPGGYVTALEHLGSGLQALSTFSSVQTSDLLHLEFTPTGPLDSSTFLLTVPSAGGATAYEIATSCGPAAIAGTTSAPITLDGCEGLADFVVSPADDNGPLGTSLYAPSITLDGAAVTINGSYQAQVSTTLTYSNVPASVQFLGVYQGLSATRRAFERTTGEVVSAGTAVATLAMPASTASVLTVTAAMPTNDELGQQQIFEWKPAASTYSLDMTSVLLPPFATMPTYSPTSRTITWTERTGALQPDVVRAELGLTRATPARAWTWRIAGPRTATTIVYPQLPVEGFDFNPTDGDTIAIRELETATVPGGYAALRQRAFSDFKRSIAGPTGRMVVQRRYAPEL
jgi:hypothetical protein